MYRIEIDRSLCSGFGSCAEHAPQSIRVGADGLAGATGIDPDGQAAIRAASACPMGAIAVFDDTDRQVA